MSSSRERRWRDRQFCGQIQCRDDLTCSICCETIERSSSLKTTVTVCNHIFHESCWANYIESHTDKEFLQFQERYSGNGDVRKLLLKMFVISFAGPPCPMCRQIEPTIHHFIRQFAELKDSRYSNKYICMSANDILHYVENKKIRVNQ